MAADRYLRFDVRRPPAGRPLLWPVRVWKILYPTSRVLKLNLFQQAILGLARARCQDRSEMAELLGLDRELVAFIIATQLIPNGWMSTLGSVTSQGERVLEEAQDAREDVRMGYAYQDAISGNWLPRFTEELPEIEAKRVDERGYSVFLRDLDSGKEDRPFRLKHFREGSLDTAALFDAFQRYRTDHDHAKQRDDELSARVRIESLSFVEDSAQPMWLWTWIFPDEAGPQPWLVADPFGLQQAASWLRKPLQEVLPRNDGLAKYIADAVGETRSNDLSAEEWLRSLENQIDLTLLADYNWSRKVPIVEGYLASVLRRKASLENQEKSWQEDVTSLLIETHNLAESVLQWLLKRFSVDVRRLPDRSQDNKWTKEMAAGILQALPIEKLDDESVRRLASQNLREIRNALIRGNSSLKALMFAALLSSVEHSDHPFRTIPPQVLQLDRMLDMADARNKKAGHSGIERVDKEDAIQYANFVIEWVQIFKDWY
ncbi:hypothetical protein LZ683_16555 [Comamonas testosteroni]|uniref:hypothetical protein n=1 Tax=Comamonas testosteroni TaxID=285 RepID=UPI0023AADA41|nr:hypothetical protein [Comamonas testosteroni]WEE75768.1 hypothetical protein LZ683_16555 [Comamonas testosteroni]